MAAAVSGQKLAHAVRNPAAPLTGPVDAVQPRPAPAATQPPPLQTDPQSDPIGAAFERMLDLSMAGKPTEALKEAESFTRALAERGGHESEADMVGVVGSVFMHNGRYGKAEQLYNRALALQEKELDQATRRARSGQAADPSKAYRQFGAPIAIGSLLKGLGDAYRSEGRTADAARLYQRALADLERRHEETQKQLRGANVTTRNRSTDWLFDWELLGLTYESMGQVAEAAAAYERGFTLIQEARRRGELRGGFAMEAPLLARLAAVLQGQGKYADAERTYRQSLAMFERNGVSSIRETMTSLLGLATVSHLQGKYADAEALYRRALSSNEATSRGTERS